MIASRAVAGFTLHTQFRGFDAAFRSKRELSGAVALEAAKDLGAGIEDAVLHALRTGVAGSERLQVRAGVMRKPVFPIMLSIQTGDQGDGLPAGAESPGFAATGKGIGVGRAFLCGPLPRVTFRTGRRTGKLGSGL